MSRERANPDPNLSEHHLGYAPAYHLARLHRASGTLPWCVAGGLVLGWLVALPNFGAHRPIANFAVLVAALLLLLPWSVAMSKSAWRLTDCWPEPSRGMGWLMVVRAVCVATPVVCFCFGLLVCAMRLGVPPVVPGPHDALVFVAFEGAAVLSAAVVGLLALTAIALWLRAGMLIRRAAVGRRGSAAARVRVGIGLLMGVVGVLALVGLDLVVRQRMGMVDFVATVALLVVGLLAVVYAWTFGALHARLSVLIGTIERAEDELRRDRRNRLGVVAGDPSMNEASATSERAPDRSADEIGPIGGHPDPPGL